MKLGASGFIIKPFGEGDLKKTIPYLADRKK